VLRIYSPTPVTPALAGMSSEEYRLKSVLRRGRKTSRKENRLKSVLRIYSPTPVTPALAGISFGRLPTEVGVTGRAESLFEETD